MSPPLLQDWDDRCTAYAESKLQCRVWVNTNGTGQVNESEILEDDDLSSGALSNRIETSPSSHFPRLCIQEDNVVRQGQSECKIKLAPYQFSECNLGNYDYSLPHPIYQLFI